MQLKFSRKIVPLDFNNLAICLDWHRAHLHPVKIINYLRANQVRGSFINDVTQRISKCAWRHKWRHTKNFQMWIYECPLWLWIICTWSAFHRWLTSESRWARTTFSSWLKDLKSLSPNRERALNSRSFVSISFCKGNISGVTLGILLPDVLKLD